MAKLKTVRIKKDGFEHGLLINEEEYDPAEHELFEEDGQASEIPPEAGTKDEDPKGNEGSGEIPDPEDLTKKSKPDLIQWAKVRNLDLGDITVNHRKDEILTAIQEAQKPADPS